MKIVEFDNFVSKEDCSRILKWFSLQSRESENPESFFNSRTIPYTKVKNSWVKWRMGLFRFDTTFQAITTYQQRLYPEYTDLVYWPIGKSMDVHSDAYQPDGSLGKYPHRKISGVLYLNDDYLGGSTYFPKQNVKITPKTGKLILFPSDLEYSHGVTTVQEADRYTMPIWFTDDFTKIEI
jgi:hypothetical protein